jgi:hypothetical protein
MTTQDSNAVAFRHGRWVLVAQGIVFALAGAWSLGTVLFTGVRPVLFGVQVPLGMAGIVGVLGLVSLACALRRRAGTILVRVQAPLFMILFMLAAATRNSGVWQAVFGYDTVDALVYLVIGLLGLVLVMWLFPHALSERDQPRTPPTYHHRGV